jgi:hypothetical protein
LFSAAITRCLWRHYYNAANVEVPNELDGTDALILQNWVPAEEDTVGARMEAAIKANVGKVLTDVAAGVGATRDAVNKMKSSATKYEALVRTEEARPAAAARSMAGTSSNAHPQHRRQPPPALPPHRLQRI